MKTMSKVLKNYNNEKLLEALKDRDDIFNSIKDEITEFNYTDEQLKIFDNLNKLTQFQKDLLYLSSTMSVYKISDLYGVSPSLLYRYLRSIQEILNKK